MEENSRNVAMRAALNASNALSKLIGKPVAVKFSRLETKPLDEISPPVGAEEVVAGTYLPVTGDVEGAALLVFPMKGALLLSDYLLKRETGTTAVLEDIEVSALNEVGNIVTGAYLTVLADISGVRLVENAPNFSFDMFGALLSQVAAEFAIHAREALIVEVNFAFTQPPIRAYFLVLLSPEDSNKIFGAAECK